MKDASVPGSAPAQPGALWHDFLASLVVFLVALPLCMGIAIGSGVPLERAASVGILSGIVGGLVVGLLSGCPLQVTGPAAGLAVIVGQLIGQHGFETLGLIVMVAGAVQILAALLGVGQWFRAVSPAVVQGMLAGIGVLIFAQQFHVMMDDEPPGKGKKFGGVINLYTIPEAVWKGLSEEEHQAAALLGVLTIVAIMGWAAFAPRRLKFVPAPLVGVLLAIAIASGFGLGVKRIPVLENLADAIALPGPAQWGRLFEWSILGAGLALAFVASAESLLTATAADAMQQHAPRTKYGKELFAQGVGNVTCGLVGALPVTGVIVRTSANILAGARTRASSMMHGLWLLVFAALFPFVLGLVPVASLAAILVYTGVKLMSPKAVRALLPYGRGEVAIYFATLVTVVVVDLLVGIAVGIGLAVAKLMATFSRLKVRLREENGRTILYLEGAATFLRLPRLAAALEDVRPNTELHVHFEELTYIDHACLDLLMNWEKQHRAMGGSLVMDWDNLTAHVRHPRRNRGRADPREGAGEEPPVEARPDRENTGAPHAH